jgi:hypothetical protein
VEDGGESAASKNLDLEPWKTVRSLSHLRIDCRFGEKELWEGLLFVIN